MQRGAFSRWTLADAEILNDFYGDDIFLFSVPLNPLSGLAGAVKVQVECFGMRLVKGEKKQSFMQISHSTRHKKPPHRQIYTLARKGRRRNIRMLGK